MECPKCKTEISDEKAVCEKCGFDVNEWDKLFGEIPKVQGLVNDFAGIISENVKKDIEEYIEKFHNETDNTVVVVTKENTEPLNPAQYVFWLFNEWGVGGKNNKGVMLFLSLKERRIESEVGFGLENVLTDEESGNILDNTVVPLLKEGKYAEGLFAGVRAIIERLSK